MKKIFALVECPKKYNYILELSSKLGISCTFINSINDINFEDEKRLLIFESTACKSLSEAELRKLTSGENLVLAMATNNESDLEKIECLYRHPQISHLFSSDPIRIEQEIGKAMYFYSTEELLKQSWMPELKVIKKIVLQNSEERWSCYDELQIFAEKLGCFQGFSGLACTIASELLNNAFYNAPRCLKTGKAKFPDRTTNVDIDPPDSVLFWYGADEEHLWLITEDPFGTLDKTTLYKSLYRAAKDRTPDWSVEVGGAGLGLYMMFDNCSEIVFNFTGNKTRVSCKMKITKRNRLFANEQVSLHIIEQCK